MLARKNQFELEVENRRHIEEIILDIVKVRANQWNGLFKTDYVTLASMLTSTIGFALSKAYEDDRTAIKQWHYCRDYKVNPWNSVACSSHSFSIYTYTFNPIDEIARLRYLCIQALRLCTCGGRKCEKCFKIHNHLNINDHPSKLEDFQTANNTTVSYDFGMRGIPSTPNPRQNDVGLSSTTETHIASSSGDKPIDLSGGQG